MKAAKPLSRLQCIVPVLFFIAGLSLLSSCDKKEEFVTDALSEWVPLAPGKYITYRVDSLVFTNFGRATETHRYQVKHLVDAQITDNLGRPAYRIFRFIRDSSGTEAWQASGTYIITTLEDQLEVTDDNLRVIQLHQPLKSGFSWKGNRHLPDNPFGPIYNFSNDDNMADWDFYYDGEPGSFSYNNKNYSNVMTVEQVDEAFNVPIANPSSYAARSRAVCRYSKEIGLVYREFEMWEYQPNPGGAGGPYKTGFGITLWMIEHN